MLGIARLAGTLLWANPGRLIVLVAGAVSVALATSGIVLAASTSLAIVRQTVDVGWRGTYDLLIRPADSPSLSVGGTAVVPLDYLGFRTSGITREEWQRISQLANVEVAAPVAALGWLKNSTPGVTAVLDHHEPGIAYVVEARATIAGQEAIQRTGVIVFLDDRQEVDIGFPDYAGPDPAYVSFRDLPATWGLVVGVDPAAEDALMGLKSHVEGQYLSTGVAEVFDPGYSRTAVGVPLLTASRSLIPGDLTVTVSTVAGVTADQIDAILRSSHPESRDQLETVIQQLVANGSRHTINSASAELREILRPLRWGGIRLGADGDLQFTEGESAGGGLLTDNNVVLAPSLAHYVAGSLGTTDVVLSPLGLWQQVVDPLLADARPDGWWPPEATFGGDSTVYRNLEVIVPPSFMLTPIGTFDREGIDAEYASAANDAPLGIYAAIPRSLVADANGRQVHDPLPVSINPSGLNPQAPVGLTNLEAVEALRGDRFIDAVRVRVAGITGYTPEAIHRIEAVAEQIVGTTGLHVDVIAGSSPVDLRVTVPGLGTMSERWTTLGTAAAIVSGAEGLSGGLLGAALLVVFAYLAIFGVFLTTDQAREVAILRGVGWRRRALVGTIATQAVALGVVAAVLTTFLSVGLAVGTGQRIDARLLALAVAAVLLAHPLAAGLAGLGGLRRRRAISPVRAPGPARTRGGITALALAFAAEAPGRALVAGVATALALTVAGLVATIEIATGGELRATLFGQVVAVRIASYHLLAAAATLFAAGALILDGALLTVERRLSLIGVLRALGWRGSAIRRLVTLESALPAALAGLAAAATVAAVAYWLDLGSLTLVIAAGVVALAVGLAVAATQLPAGLAVRIAPATSLRAEGASGIVGGFAPRQALLAVTSVAVIVGLVAGGLGATEGSARAPLPFVSPTEHPLSPIAIRIQGDVAAIAAYPDRAPGSVSFSEAISYVGDALGAVGYNVTAHPYLSPQPEYLDSLGHVVETAGSSLPALAYDATIWDGRDLKRPATFIDATAGRSADGCPPGIAVIRIADFLAVPVAEELQRRCVGSTAGVLAVRVASDDSWETLAGRVVQIRLPVSHYLTGASPAAAKGGSAPWLVAVLDSRGPGASQSAAPIAVALEVARQAASAGLALRIGVVGGSDQAAGSVFLERMRTVSIGPSIWLGPMGGLVAPVLGTTAIRGLDHAAATSGLLWIAPVDAAFPEWLALAEQPSDKPTSDELLAAIAHPTGLRAGEELSVNAGPLTAEFDAAWLGEPSVPTSGPPSIAGTPADTADQIHALDLEQLASAVFAAIGALEQ